LSTDLNIRRFPDEPNAGVSDDGTLGGFISRYDGARVCRSRQGLFARPLPADVSTHTIRRVVRRWRVGRQRLGAVRRRRPDPATALVHALSPIRRNTMAMLFGTEGAYNTLHKSLSPRVATVEPAGTLTREPSLIDAGGGNDVVQAGDRGVEIDGGAGSDRLLGGAGSDTLISGDNLAAELVLLNGGSGADRMTSRIGPSPRRSRT
jgi:RTX calcium-binding nonapeptide repeat (4 copies)